jgi:hypothetical protein
MGELRPLAAESLRKAERAIDALGSPFAAWADHAGRDRLRARVAGGTLERDRNRRSTCRR